MTLVAPDYLDPVLGWRAWLVVEQQRKLRLRSLIFPAVWRPDEEFVAECRRRSLLPWRRRSSRHGAPAEHCACGVYAAADLATAVHYLTTPCWEGDGLLRVLGRVALWGDLVEHDRGWRGAQAYPTALYVPFRPQLALLAEEIALGLTDYHVPVQLVETTTRGELVRMLQEAEASVR